MVCTVVTLPNGSRALVCGPRRRMERCGCGAPAGLLCDWKVAGGTCDAPICRTCTTSPAPDKDLCPEHAQTWRAWKAGQP